MSFLIKEHKSSLSCEAVAQQCFDKINITFYIKPILLLMKTKCILFDTLVVILSFEMSKPFGLW